jgi:hypothetical protein
MPEKKFLSKVPIMMGDIQDLQNGQISIWNAHAGCRRPLSKACEMVDLLLSSLAFHHRCTHVCRT